ncbi:uncharacterized protein HaLaN_09205, partial [Haematococcus lacustris]
AVWEVYLDPKWARQRLRLYKAHDQALEQFLKQSDEPSRPLAEAQHEEQDPSAKAAAILDRAPSLVLLFLVPEAALAAGSGPLPARAPATSRPTSLPSLMTEEMPRQIFPQLRSQESEELAAASRTQLPPLQSIMELTTAHLAPSRQGEVAGEEAVAAPAPVGRQLADGQGVLADGTHWEKKSGEELGEGGFWKRWTLLKGWTEDGTVAFEECWWESSDWAGMKELGATKSGHTPSGKSHLT